MPLESRIFLSSYDTQCPVVHGSFFLPNSLMFSLLLCGDVIPGAQLSFLKPVEGQSVVDKDNFSDASSTHHIPLSEMTNNQKCVSACVPAESVRSVRSLCMCFLARMLWCVCCYRCRLLRLEIAVDVIRLILIL